MVYAGLFVVANLVVDYAQIDVREELASHIGYLLVLCMVVNCILIELGVLLAHLHEVNANAVVS